MQNRKINMKVSLPIIAIAFAVLFCPAAYTRSTPDLTTLVDRSTVILVGKVTSIQELKTPPYDNIDGQGISTKIIEEQLAINRIIKGSVSGNVTVRIAVPSRSVGYRVIPQGVRRVIFLRQDKSTFVPTDPYYPSIPAGQSEFPVATDQTTTETVVDYMTAVFQPPMGDVSARDEALWLLNFVDLPKCRQILRGVAAFDPDAKTQLIAVGELIKRGDLTLLDRAKQVLMNPVATGIPSGWQLDELVQSLCSAISTIRDERATPILAEIITSRDVRARRAAAEALRNTSSPTAIIPLIAALKDSDFDVRYWAAIGLAEITGQSNWRPLESEFRANETKYIAHWVSWHQSDQSH